MKVAALATRLESMLDEFDGGAREADDTGMLGMPDGSAFVSHPGTDPEIPASVPLKR
jgi:hypothetical protein